MMINKKQSGFTTIELLITLFIAAMFLASGYQLYGVIIKEGGGSRMQAIASNNAYDYLQKYKLSATDPCTTQTPLNNQSITITGLSNTTITIAIDCPYGTASSVSRITSNINYGNPQKTVSNSTFIYPNCPTGFIKVPGSATYQTNDFCVMKYEAKNDGSGKAVSTAAGLPWVSIAQSGTNTNVSQGKTATAALLVDGVVTSDPYYGLSGRASVTVDLQQVRSINTVKLWHYWADGRTYYGTKTEVSADGTNWTTIFDSATSGTYAESSAGKTILLAAPINARYIRDWLSGSTANTGSHWVEIQAFEYTSTDATSKSAAACTGCHLITEAEWMTIAQNVLSVPSNWSGGAVGSGYIYSGHNDGTPNNSLAASTDSDGYSGTGQSSGNQRRTLTLTNGEVIWDFAGNVWEWTSDIMNGGQQPGLSGESAYAWKEWNNASLLMNWLPTTSQPSSTGLSGAASWSSANGIGKLWSNYGEAAVKGIRRSGNWGNGANAGILSMLLDTAPTYAANTDLGFRVAR